MAELFNKNVATDGDNFERSNTTIPQTTKKDLLTTATKISILQLRVPRPMELVPLKLSLEPGAIERAINKLHLGVEGERIGSGHEKSIFGHALTDYLYGGVKYRAPFYDVNGPGGKVGYFVGGDIPLGNDMKLMVELDPLKVTEPFFGIQIENQGTARLGMHIDTKKGQPTATELALEVRKRIGKHGTISGSLLVDLGHSTETVASSNHSLDELPISPLDHEAGHPQTGTGAEAISAHPHDANPEVRVHLGYEYPW